MEIIDIHCHFDHGAVGESAKRNELHKADLAFLKKERERLGIKKTFMSSFSSVCSTERIYEENEYLFEKMQKATWLYQWVVLDPREKRLFSQVESLLKKDKIVGIKIHPELHKYEILDYADEIFAFANEHKTTVLMHPPATIVKTAAVADKYPDMNLIIAHLGVMEHIDAIANAKHGNVYTDTSGQASYKNNILEYAVEKVGSEKIFFGTDTYSCAFQVGRILLAGISKKDKENILRNNAIKFFIK
ncbi:MAG: amidohydrolase family protein [Clostridia bacterium]|nr:amidohydrolase family protein [Clostridia bacterium]